MIYYKSIFEKQLPEEYKNKIPNGILSFAEVQQVFIKHLKYNNYEEIIYDLNNFKKDRELNINFNVMENTINESENIEEKNIEIMDKKDDIEKYENDRFKIHSRFRINNDRGHGKVEKVIWKPNEDMEFIDQFQRITDFKMQ